MFKKIISVSIILAMVLSAFSVYANAANSKESPDADRVMTIYGKYELTLGEGPSPESDRVQAEIESKVGFKFNIIPVAGDSYLEKMNIVLASGEEFDWLGNLGASGRKWAELSRDGLIMPLNDLIEEYGQNITEKMGNGFLATTGADGNIWSIPWFISNHWGNTPTIRNDWSAKAGMPELPRTIEEFEEYMEFVLNTDLNENGINDEIPLLPINQGTLTHQLKGLIMGEEFVGNYYQDENGDLQIYYSHPSYMDFLDVLRDWYAKGYIYSEFFVIKAEQAGDLIGADRVGAYMNWYSMVITPFTPIREQDMSKDYSMLPALQSSSENVTSAYNIGTQYQDGVYIPASSKNPDLTIKYINWLLDEPENYLTALRGFENEHWEWTNKDELLFRIYPDAQAKYYRLMCPSVNFSWFDMPITDEPNETIRSQMYYEFMMEALSPITKYVAPFDLYTPYTTVGTELEMSANDGKTLIDENELKYIIGEIDKKAMQSAIDQYMKIYGDALNKISTEQYKAFKGIE